LPKAALDEARQHYIAEAEADWETRYRGTKKPVEEAKPDNNDDEADAINHDGTTDPHWDGVMTSFTHVPKTKKGKNVIIVEGGLALTVSPPDPDPAHQHADEDERPSLGFELNQTPRTTVTREDKKITTNGENHSPNMEPEPNTTIPKVKEMSIEDRALSLSNAMATLVQATDPDTLAMLQLVLETAHIDKINMSNPAASSSNPAASPPADADMGDAAGDDLPTKMTRVDLESSDDESEHDLSY